MKKQLFWFIILFIFCSCTAINYSIIDFDTDISAENQHISGRLDTMALVQQPRNSLFCGAACIGMVENYYFNASNSLDYIFERVSLKSVQGRRYNATYKMGAYLENTGLISSIVKFSDLGKMLNYCEENQIPAIMNIQDVKDQLLGHFIVFTGYNPDTGIITILDPQDSNRRTIRYNDLKNDFIKTSDRSELGGNIMILSSDRISTGGVISCKNCNKENIFDTSLLQAITGIICNGCDSFIRLH